jgi:hypothetical protein
MLHQSRVAVIARAHRQTDVRHAEMGQQSDEYGEYPRLASLEQVISLFMHQGVPERIPSAREPRKLPGVDEVVHFLEVHKSALDLSDSVR